MTVRACLTLIAALVATPALAATSVVQTQSFNFDVEINAGPEDFGPGSIIIDLFGEESNSLPIAFQPFDTSLGTLTGAKLSIASIVLADQTAFLIGEGAVSFTEARASVALLNGGQVLTGLSASPAFGRNLISCQVGPGGAPCSASRTETLVLEPELDVLALVSGPDAPVFTLRATAGGEAFLFRADPASRPFAEVSTAWLGDLTLTYTYTAASTAVPEPESWALMIGGFGVTGGAMRVTRRRRKASALPA